MPSAAARTAAARRAQHRRTPARRAPARRGPWARVRWDRIGRTSLLIVLAVVAGLYIQHAVDYLTTRGQANQEHAIVQRLAHDNAALRRQQQALGDPVTIK